MKIKENLKTLIGLTLAFIIVFFMLVSEHKNNSLFEYTFKGDTFYTSENADFEIEQQFRVFTIKDIEGENATVYSGYITLEPGSYDIDFQYALSGVDSAEYNLFSQSYLCEDNTFGKSFSQGTLSADESALMCNITTEQQIRDLVLEITVPADAEFSIGRFTLTSDTVRVNDYLVLAALSVAVYIFIVYMLCRPKPLASPAVICAENISGRRISFALLFIMAIMAIFVSVPLFTDSLSAGYDLLFHLNRIEGIALGLKSGQFPVRIHPQHLSGYGYPNGIFYPELFLYFPAFLRLAGMSLAGAYKVFAFAVNLATVYIAYISFSKLLKSRFMGMFAAILYTVSPYRLACVYERSAVGEYLAMVFLPLVMYGLYAVIFGDKKDWKYLFLGATALIQSHILTTEIAVFFCAVVAFAGIKNIFGKEKRFIEIIKALVSTVMVNLWFLIPFLMMSLQLDIAVFKRSTSLAEYAIAQINEMFSVQYLREFRTNIATSSPSGMGFVFMAVFVVFVAYIILKKSPSDEYKNHLLSMGKLLSGFIVFTAVISTSIFPWERVQSVGIVSSIVGSLQFPNRTFSVMMLSFAVLSAVVVLLLTSTEKERIYVAMSIVLVSMFSANMYMDTVNYFAASPNRGNKFQYDLKTYNTECIALGEYVSRATSLQDLFGRADKIETSDNVEISNLEKNGTTICFEYKINDYDAAQQYSAIVPLTMYPTYTAEINGVEYDTYVAYGNYVRFDLTDSQGQVKVSYSRPKVFALAEITSLLALAVVTVRIKFPITINKKK